MHYKRTRAETVSADRFAKRDSDSVVVPAVEDARRAAALHLLYRKKMLETQLKAQQPTDH